jgi:hypothetical protein
MWWTLGFLFLLLLGAAFWRGHGLATQVEALIASRLAREKAEWAALGNRLDGRP